MGSHLFISLSGVPHSSLTPLPLLHIQPKHRVVVVPLPPVSPLLPADWLKGKRIMHRWDGEFGGWFKQG